MLQITLNSDEKVVDEVRAALRKNNGYCPCAILKTDNTKCMCKAFREQKEPGLCHCGLFQKIEI